MPTREWGMSAANIRREPGEGSQDGMAASTLKRPHLLL